MAFIQIIEQQTSRVDEINALVEEMRATRKGPSPVRRVTVAQDRDNQGRYFTIVEFESYEVAMENSNSPETQEMAARLAELLDAPPVFHNLDVVSVETFD